MLFTFIICLFQTEPAWGNVKPGDTPPPVTIESVIQGDLQGSFTLEDLKGKPVVLEFWASWCVPCVQAIPHMNDLIAAFGDRAHFLNLSTESEAVIRRTATSKGMKGQVVRVPEAVFLSYGARAIPHTVVLDAEGKVAGITRPKELTAARLERLVRGEPVRFPDFNYKPASLEQDETLFGQVGNLFGQVVFQIDDTDGTGVRFVKPGHLLFSGASLSVLLQIAYGVNEHQLDWASENPRERYRVSVVAPDGRNETAKRLLAQSLPTMLGIQVKQVQAQKEVYVLKRREDKGLPLEPSQEKRSTSANGNSLNIRGGTMNDLASLLGDFAVYAPVVNETGVEGTYSVALEWLSGDQTSIQEALADIGLVLTKNQRPVDVLRIEASSP